MIKAVPKLINIGVYDASLIYKNTTESKRRIVNHYEVEYVLENGGITHVNDVEYEIKKNNIICAKPGQIRYTTLPFKCLFFHIVVEDEELIEKLEKVPDVFSPENPEEYFGLFTQAITSSVSLDLNKISLVIKTFELFSLLFKEAEQSLSTQSQKPHHKEIAEKAIKFIDENFHKPIAEEDIAEHVHLSKIYFHNLFLTATSYTPHRYVLEKRLALAKKLLIIKDKPFAEIASECGFSSQSYFNYVFKREFGVNPRMYIRQMSMDWEKTV